MSETIGKFVFKGNILDFTKIIERLILKYGCSATLLDTLKAEYSKTEVKVN